MFISAPAQPQLCVPAVNGGGKITSVTQTYGKFYSYPPFDTALCARVQVDGTDDFCSASYMFNYARASMRGCGNKCTSATDSRGSDASDECSLEYMFRSDATTDDELIFGIEL